MAFQIYTPQPGSVCPVRGVLFDMDGLVLDTEKLYARFWAEACADFGFSMSREQALGMRSLSRSAGQARLKSYFGPDADYAAIRSRRILRMEAYISLHGVEPKPGITELLDYLQFRHLPCAITSSSPSERILRYLEPLGLAHRFDHLCSGYDVPRGKPEPDIYLYGAACLNLIPENCLALEDSPAGILSAHRAGCRCVMIPDQDLPDGPTLPLLFARADSLADVIPILESLP